MQIRKAVPNDLEAILECYIYARELMKQSGNPTQWGDHRPSEERIRKDIEEQMSYVVVEDDMICGVFAFMIGDESTYQNIYEGTWINADKYGVIHRIATNGRVHGIMQCILSFCENQIHNIRIDTHADNKIMQHILVKSGYIKCGIIYVDDGTKRLAYQKCN